MLGATFEVDHVVELQHGGTNHVNNLMALCPNCHREKGLMNKIEQ
jgi:5-methylcytosine-specific restriction endonuclease McrA